MRNGTVFDPYAARAAYNRQVLAFLAGVLMVGTTLGLTFYGVYWVFSGKFLNTNTRREFTAAPAAYNGCADSPDVRVYRTWDNVLLYTRRAGELCAWRDTNGNIRIVAERSRTLDMRAEYLRELYRGVEFSCPQAPRKTLFGEVHPPPRTEVGTIERGEFSVCVVACGVAQDCATDKFVVRGTGDAAFYEAKLRRLITAGRKPVARR